MQERTWCTTSQNMTPAHAPPRRADARHVSYAVWNWPGLRGRCQPLTPRAVLTRAKHLVEICSPHSIVRAMVPLAA